METPPEPFWPVFVISLPGDTARRQRIDERLSACGVPYSFFDAIDGRQGLPPRYEPMVDRIAARKALKGRDMSDAELACALSHRSVYAHVLDSGLPGAVILEDDALPQPALADFLAIQGYRHGELTLLDHGQMIPWFGRWVRLPGVGIAIPIGFRANYATGYAVSRAGAEKLLAATNPVRGVADWPLDLRRLRTLACLPRPVRRNAGHFGDSHIERSRKPSFERWRKVPRK